MSEEEKALLARLTQLLDEHPESHQERNRQAITRKLRDFVDFVEYDVNSAKRWAKST